MAQIKTAISLKDSLLEQADKLASKLEISRSRFFSLAVEAYIQSLENRKLLEDLNAAYQDEADSKEQNHLKQMKSKQRKLVKGQW